MINHPGSQKNASNATARVRTKCSFRRVKFITFNPYTSQLTMELFVFNYKIFIQLKIF
jgi:hypothetical protein